MSDSNGMTRSVSFIIVNYFSAQMVIQLVNSIEKWIKRYRYEILICDNSVDRVETELLQSLQSGAVRLFMPAENLGFVRACNALADRSMNDLVVILNPDTLLLDSSLENLFDYVYTSEQIGVIGPKLLNEDGSEQVGHYRFPTLKGVLKEHIILTRRNPYAYHGPMQTRADCDVVKGACLVMRRSTIGTHGLFDSRIVMYSEEVDLCRRLSKAGLHNVFFPEARIVHYGEKSTRTDRSNAYSLWHYHRSRIIYFRKHYSPLHAWVVLAIIVISLIEKAIGLALVRKTSSSKAHLFVLKKLFIDNPLMVVDWGKNHVHVDDLVERSIAKT